MLYLIGLGMNEKGISLEGKEAAAKCHEVYLEGYTVDFPYIMESLEKVIGKKIERLEREKVESDNLIKSAKTADIAVLVYGSPLFATTHETLIIDAKKAGVKTKIIHASSVFDALGETGLQLYKFGKITSMPAWKKNFTPDSFMDIVKENLSIDAHSLILIDIGLGIEDALHQLKVSASSKKIKLPKIVICSKLGTGESKILYGSLDILKAKLANEDEEIELPYCIIIPAKLHFMEKEALENLQ
jgi:diphthine synthase